MESNDRMAAGVSHHRARRYGDPRDDTARRPRHVDGLEGEDYRRVPESVRNVLYYLLGINIFGKGENEVEPERSLTDRQRFLIRVALFTNPLEARRAWATKDWIGLLAFVRTTAEGNPNPRSVEEVSTIAGYRNPYGAQPVLARSIVAIYERFEGTSRAEVEAGLMVLSRDVTHAIDFLLGRDFGLATAEPENDWDAALADLTAEQS